MSYVQTFIDYFKSNELVYFYAEEKDLVITRFGGEPVTVELVIRATDSLALLDFRIPFTISQSYRPSIGEFITRANFGMKIGAFQMDMDDGELRFSVHQMIPDVLFLNDELISDMIRIGVSTVRRYYSGIMKLNAGIEISPADLVSSIETAMLVDQMTRTDEA